MAAIDFTKKGLNQMIFAKRAVRASRGKNSSAFKAILADKNVAHVINKSSEKKVFYNALKERGQASNGHGITKNVLRKVLGDIEHSGEFSHHEMMDLRKHLVGGPVGLSIVRDHKSSHNDDFRQKQETITHEHINEIISKGHEKDNEKMHLSSSNFTKNGDIRHNDKCQNSTVQENVLVKLETSAKNVRKYENSVFSPNVKHFSENHSTAFGHVRGLKPSQYNHFGAKDMKIEEAKTRLASIQEETVESKKEKLK